MSLYPLLSWEIRRLFEAVHYIRSSNLKPAHLPLALRGSMVMTSSRISSALFVYWLYLLSYYRCNATNSSSVEEQLLRKGKASPPPLRQLLLPTCNRPLSMRMTLPNKRLQGSDTFYMLIVVSNDGSKAINGVNLKIGLPSPSQVTFIKDKTSPPFYRPKGHLVSKERTIYLLDLRIPPRKNVLFMLKLRIARCADIGELSFEGLLYLTNQGSGTPFCFLPSNAPLQSNVSMMPRPWDLLMVLSDTPHFLTSHIYTHLHHPLYITGAHQISFFP